MEYLAELPQQLMHLVTIVGAAFIVTLQQVYTDPWYSGAVVFALAWGVACFSLLNWRERLDWLVATMALWATLGVILDPPVGKHSVLSWLARAPCTCVAHCVELVTRQLP